MGLNASEVTAVLVTRGDVDLSEILATLPYGEVVVHDNSALPVDSGAYGRYLTAERATREVCYFQDDDVIFSAHDALLAAYEPGKLVANMPSPWYERTGYDVLGQAMVGAGSLVDRDLPRLAIDRYLERWPQDDLFRAYVDEVVGMLTPHTRHDFGYEVLPVASAPGRTWTSPGAAEKKALMRERALALR